jgi:hypothetical protein
VIAQPASTRVVNLSATANLQAALNAAQPGDELVLPAGAIYKGSFTLPKKIGNAWITIRSSQVASLPPGVRVKPAQAALMPRIVGVTQGDAAIVTEPGAHHYRFVGIELASTPNVRAYDVVALGTGWETSLAELPHDLVFDRCWVHGDPTYGVGGGILLNANAVTVANSWISDIKGPKETQALLGWNGAGPFTIVNNELEAAGENLMFGGADATLVGLVPSNIVIRYNRFTKPVAWRGDSRWMVKNLLELKSARNVTIDGNLFEYCWAAGQSGEAALFTVRNQDGGAPWSTVENVTFTRNRVQHTGGGISILGHDPNAPSGAGDGFLIENNLLTDIGGSWGGWGRFVYLDSGTSQPGPTAVHIDHNTALTTGGPLVSDTPSAIVPRPGLVFSSNLVVNNHEGVWGPGESQGDATLRAYYPNGVFTGNALVGGPAASYSEHPGNLFPATLAELQPDATWRVHDPAWSGGADVGQLDAAAACRTP